MRQIFPSYCPTLPHTRIQTDTGISNQGWGQRRREANILLLFHLFPISVLFLLTFGCFVSLFSKTTPQTVYECGPNLTVPWIQSPLTQWAFFLINFKILIVPFKWAANSSPLPFSSLFSLSLPRLSLLIMSLFYQGCAWTGWVILEITGEFSALHSVTTGCQKALGASLAFSLPAVTIWPFSIQHMRLNYPANLIM